MQIRSTIKILSYRTFILGLLVSAQLAVLITIFPPIVSAQVWNLQRDGSGNLNFYYGTDSSIVGRSLQLNPTGTGTIHLGRFRDADGLEIYSPINDAIGLQTTLNGHGNDGYGGEAANRLVLQQVTGRVGIGTADPQAKFHISDTSGDGLIFYRPSEDTFALQTLLNGQPNNGTGGDPANRLILQPTAGRVGIGTNSPISKFHIRDAGGDGIAFYKLGEDALGIQTALNDQDVLGAQYGYGGDPPNRLVLQPVTGRVGIGVADPQYKLDVAGGVKADYFYTPSTGTWLNYPGNGWNYIRGSTFAWNSVAWHDENNPGYYFDPSGGSNLNDVNAVSGNTVSDIRLKKDVTSLEDSLSRVLKLLGVNYYYRQDTEFGDTLPTKQQVGLIAQEVEQVVPEIVSTNENGYKSVEYGKLSGVLIEAIKEQQSQIEQLRQEIKELKTK
jgi:hypothetical protein